MNKIQTVVVGAAIAVMAAGCCSTMCAKHGDLQLCGNPDSSQWEDVFNEDLSNAEMPKGSWARDNDGCLVPITGDTIISKKDYANFVIDAAYVMEPTANSGLFIYDTKHPTHKFEIQIIDDNHPKYANGKPYQKTGAIYGRLAPSKICTKPAGELNRMVAYCLGSHIVIFVNGEKVVDDNLSRWTNPDVNPDGTQVPTWHKGFPALGTIPMHGPVGVQGIHGGKGIKFKHIKIKEIK